MKGVITQLSRLGWGAMGVQERANLHKLIGCWGKGRSFNPLLFLFAIPKPSGKQDIRDAMDKKRIC